MLQLLLLQLPVMTLMPVLMMPMLMLLLLVIWCSNFSVYLYLFEKSNQLKVMAGSNEQPCNSKRIHVEFHSEFVQT